MRTIEEIIISPRSIAIVGASDNPDKIGGRPIKFMKRYGYQGKLYAVNPVRNSVQGLATYPTLADLPEVPELAYIAVSGQDAVTATESCAYLGVKVAVIISSGFGEVDELGKARQDELVTIAQRHGMRIIGPNSNGLANFGTGAIPGFSTMFEEMPPHDGPVAIVSQSGAMCQVAYGQLRERNIGIRHVHAIGNEADITVADVAYAVLQDPDVKILLLYFESLRDPEKLAEVAALGRRRGVPIIAIKAGRSVQGQLAASSHTGALASEDRIVDAFLAKHGIWRAYDTHEQIRCVEMYLKGWKPRGTRLAIISNSGASCVIGADIATDVGLELAELAPSTRDELAQRLPGFAATRNPIDITAALLTNSGLFGSVLPVVQQDPAVDMVFIQIPVSGAAYDVVAFARDTAAFIEDSSLPVAVCTWQKDAIRAFREYGVPTFHTARDAMEALAQLARHHAALNTLHEPSLIAQGRIEAPFGQVDENAAVLLSEAESLAILSDAGVPVVPHVLCDDHSHALNAFTRLGASVVVKACSQELPHKSEHGLVTLNVTSEQALKASFESHRQTLAKLGVAYDGIIVAAMEKGLREFMVGAKRDPVFGAVVMVGDGGKYVEVVQDFEILLPPFTADEVLVALTKLRIAPLLAGVRGEPPLDVVALADIVVKVGALILSDSTIASVDLNPVMVKAESEGAVVVDALLERRCKAHIDIPSVSAELAD